MVINFKSLKRLDSVIDELNLLAQTINNEKYNKIIKELNEVYSDLEDDVSSCEAAIEEMEEEVYILRDKENYLLDYYDDEL